MSTLDAIWHGGPWVVCRCGAADTTIIDHPTRRDERGAVIARAVRQTTCHACGRKVRHYAGATEVIEEGESPKEAR